MHISINGKQVLMHRFIYEAFNGEIPEGYEIDHKNTVRDDNRLENLRIATPKENRNNPITKERYKTSNKGKVTPQLIEKLKSMHRQKSGTPKTTYNKPKTRQDITKELKKQRVCKNTTKPKEQRVEWLKKVRKVVYQFTTDGKLINEFESVLDCSKKTGLQRVNISQCCNGERKTSGGFKFSFNKQM